MIKVSTEGKNPEPVKKESLKKDTEERRAQA